MTVARLEINKLTIGTEDEAGTAVIHCKAATGEDFSISLDTMSMQTLASFLAESFTHVVDLAGKTPRLAPHADRVSLELGTKWGTEILRVFVSPQLYHEYSVSSDTNIGRHFRELGNLISRDQNGCSVSAPGVEQ